MIQRIFDETFADFASPEIRSRSMHEPIAEVIESVLSLFNQRTAYIIKAREGLPPHKKMTLKELGTVYTCSSERIRQIEGKFWEKMKHTQTKAHSPLIAILLTELMQNQGSLVLDSEHKNTPFICFLAKCLGIPLVHTKLGFIVLGVAELDLTELSISVVKDNPSKYLAERLDASSLSYLARRDIHKIAEAIAGNRFSRRLNKIKKVYLALKSIGKPAHFSEITETYNSLFYDDWISERNVYYILSRCAKPNREQYGIVWIRIKGTYALKEHGYERPRP